MSDEHVIAPEAGTTVRIRTDRYLAVVRDAVVSAVRRGADECEIRLMYDVSRTEIDRILQDALKECRLALSVRVSELHANGLNDHEIGRAIGRSHVAVWNERQRLGLPRNASPGRQRGEPDGRA